MNIDIQSLFRDILETPEQRQQRELAETTLRSREMTRNITSRYAAPFAGMVPGFLSNVNRATTGLGSALGLDMRSTSDKAQEALSGLDLTDPQSVQNTVQMLRNVGLGSQAAQILRMSTEAIRDEKVKDLQLKELERRENVAATAVERTSQLRQSLAGLIENSRIDENKRQAIRVAINAGAYDNKVESLIEKLYPDQKDRFEILKEGEGIWDLDSGTWIIQPQAKVEEGITVNELHEQLNLDSYDPASVTSFLEVVANNGIVDVPKITQNLDLLMPKAGEDFYWSTGYDENNNTIPVQLPVAGTDSYKEDQQEINAANNRGEIAIRDSENAIRVTDNLINALEEGENVTGITGIALSLVPGTNSANFTADQNTLLANLGISSLQELRAASQNGASGFGQLTQRELQRLEERVGNLTKTQTPEQLMANLIQIRQQFSDIVNNTKTDWTFEQWRGVARRPEASGSANEFNTSSGVYTVSPIEN